MAPYDENRWKWLHSIFNPVISIQMGPISTRIEVEMEIEIGGIESAMSSPHETRFPGIDKL